MKSVRFICSVAVLASTVSAHGLSTEYNLTLARKDLPATKTSSDVPLKVPGSVPAPMLDAVSLSAPSVVGGNVVQGRVTINVPAPFDLEVSLAVDPPSGAKAPSSVTVKAGETSAAFPVTTPVSKMLVGGADNLVSIYGNYGVTKHVDLAILAPVSFDRMVDRVIQREHAFVDNIKRLHPLAETYIQNMQEDKQHNVIPTSDRYFLGRLDLSQTTSEQVFEKDKPGKAHHFLSPFAMLGNAFSRRYVPQGFANMVVMDRDLKKENYYFNFVRQEFLGEIRCIVVDVQPREHAPAKQQCLLMGGLRPRRHHPPVLPSAGPRGCCTISERKDVRIARRLQGFGHHQLIQSIDLETVERSKHGRCLDARRPNHQIGRQKATVGGVHPAGIDVLPHDGAR